MGLLKKIGSSLATALGFTAVAALSVAFFRVVGKPHQTARRARRAGRRGRSKNSGAGNLGGERHR